jgi:sortase (surface protein transpeptidase)
MYPAYTGSVTVNVEGLKANTTYAAMIYKGTCATPTALVKLAGVRTDGFGNGSKTTSFTRTSGYAIWGTAAHGTVAVRVASGSSRFCGLMSFALATRVQIPKYNIDLPIVAQPSGTYPYCNVAMYASALSQPGEAGPTFIYAHARVGMFLPLLTASKSNNGAAMIGMTVRVWTSDSQLYTYQITRVLRHQYSIPAYDPNSEILWLQTSEGPHGTKNKLFITGRRVSVESASYGDSHPTPHIVRCGF